MFSSYILVAAVECRLWLEYLLDKAAKSQSLAITLDKVPTPTGWYEYQMCGLDGFASGLRYKSWEHLGSCEGLFAKYFS